MQLEDIDTRGHWQAGVTHGHPLMHKRSWSREPGWKCGWYGNPQGSPKLGILLCLRRRRLRWDKHFAPLLNLLALVHRIQIQRIPHVPKGFVEHQQNVRGIVGHHLALGSNMIFQPMACAKKRVPKGRPIQGATYPRGVIQGATLVGQTGTHSARNL